MNIAPSTDQTNYKCQDKLLCLELEFNKDVCGIANVRDACCDSCTQYCQDGPDCKKYPSIEKLCDISVEIRRACPDSCGDCPSKEYNRIV